jgi:hypothetical protein
MDAPSIRIPERYQSGIAKLIALAGNSLEELLLALNDTPRSLNLDRIKESFDSKIPSLAESDIDELITTLDALYYLKTQSGVSVQDFCEQILQAMDESGNNELQMDADGRERFSDRLIQLMSGKLFDVVIQSRNVLYEQERTFGSSRILSDIRLITGNNNETTPSAGVIIHTLKIHYFQNDQHQEFFISLDTEDVDVLIEELISAQERAKMLKSTLAAANVPYIDAE